MSSYCENCGSKSYNGHCTWCHEETYIAEQNYSNDEPIAFSDEFKTKLIEQAEEAAVILEIEQEKEKNNTTNQEEQ